MFGKGRGLAPRPTQRNRFGACRRTHAASLHCVRSCDRVPSCSRIRGLFDRPRDRTRRRHTRYSRRGDSSKSRCRTKRGCAFEWSAPHVMSRRCTNGWADVRGRTGRDVVSLSGPVVPVRTRHLRLFTERGACVPLGVRSVRVRGRRPRPAAGSGRVATVARRLTARSPHAAAARHRALRRNPPRATVGDSQARTTSPIALASNPRLENSIARRPQAHPQTARCASLRPSPDDHRPSPAA